MLYKDQAAQMDQGFPDAVLFDLDNTIADRVSAVRRLAQRLYHDEPYLHGGISMEQAVRTFEEADQDGLAFDKVVMFRVISERWGGLSRTPEQLVSWLNEAYPQCYEPDERVTRLLRTLSEAKVPWGVVSNGAAFQRPKAERLGLDRLTDCIVISSEVGYRKPQREIFLEALKRLGSPKPERTLYVGDSIEADICGAQAVGMQTAWVSRGRQWPPSLKPPTCTVEHVDELFAS